MSETPKQSGGEQHKQICKTLTETYEKKNKDYGNSFIATRNEYNNAILIRLNDKFYRLKELIKSKERMVVNESIYDTLLDMANYCIMEMMEIEREVEE